MTRLVFQKLLIVLVLFNSCVEKIEFDLDRLDRERLIVSGTLTDLAETQFVYLSQTTSNARQPFLEDGDKGLFTLNDLPRPVSRARVRLHSRELGLSWEYRETKPGTYELSGFLPPRPGLEYELEIWVQEKVYRSQPQRMPEVVGEDQLSFSFERARLENNPEAALIAIATEVTLPNQTGGYYLRWTVEEVYFWDLTFFPNPFNTPPPPCYVTEISDAARITLVNGDLLNRPGAVSSQILAKRLVDQSFLSRHYFNVKQLSITKDAHDYWRKVRQLVNNTGSVFDIPPAPIRGNMYHVDDPEEVVLGYFEVAKAKITRIYTTRADVPFFLEEVCEYVPGKRATEYKPTCLSCNVFPNSTSQQPEWWFDQ
ncbi:uncharacterized protein DUF4249 [Algoriphagus aquaeductus]|uniref:Uncharacterized protein DUF4249 n=1 Tax=Algoriphagus aquaeductus TaxID=475299 RepID=A0A326RM35_9BACT|nr:DUF4249 domain-containing protein [Algoriphagus aquaeductus]PZV78093.1 uncharacterized protein DUF4249 [Algoriphagus aquaeductus]